jgi:hypothetical protein
LYNKYFKMMKVGLPKEAIKAKMIQEGANPLYLEKEPSELVPLTEPKVFYYFYVDSLSYFFGWSAFLCRIRFCDTLVVIFFICKHHHHHHQGP